MILIEGTKAGKVIAAVYLGVVCVATLPLLLDGAIHHGNGISLLAAMVLTSPLSWIFFWMIDRTIHPNAFYLTGWVYGLEILVIAFCAAVNALVIIFLVAKIQGAGKRS